MSDYPVYHKPVPQPTADFSLGACRDYPTTMFFPERGDHHGIYMAKAVCASCSIRQACLDFALESREAYGVWGGMSGKERREERSRRHRQRIASTTPVSVSL